MKRLLPVVANFEDFYRERSWSLADWLPALQSIAERHGLVKSPVLRFDRGESPVFSLGDDFVVKLLPALLEKRARQEADLLSFLRPYPAPPAPRLVGQGHIEDWIYLVMTRISGTPLHEAWPSVPPDQRASLAGAYGRSLAALHDLPISNLDPGGIDWSAFCHESMTLWPERNSVRQLPPALQADGPRYFGKHAKAVIQAPRVMLHGDLAPENLMVRESNGRWEIAALIDFGNAMRGDAWFDLTAATILLDPGNRTVVHALIDGCKPGTSSRLGDVRPQLMINTLLHPLGDIAACLSLYPGAAGCRTWDEVALRFWPD